MNYSSSKTAKQQPILPQPSTPQTMASVTATPAIVTLLTDRMLTIYKTVMYRDMEAARYLITETIDTLKVVQCGPEALNSKCLTTMLRTLRDLTHQRVGAAHTKLRNLRFWIEETYQPREPVCTVDDIIG